MVVVSGLPLLMVRGQFASLDTMTVEDLETFIPFMTQCSVYRASAAIINNAPSWWHNSIKFRFPLQKPSAVSIKRYRRHLVSIVTRCYHYHNRHAILQFCSQLTKNLDSVVLIPNDDDTTSLFNVRSRLPILTFNNQNQEYDKYLRVKKEPPKSPRRCLLPAKKPITDIYLCENCDAEFSTANAIAAHERKCYGVHQPPPAEPEPHPADLLGYLQLGAGPPPETSSKPPLKLSLLKNKQVEFSSLLGRRILNTGSAKRDLVSRPEKLIQQYEFYCFVSPRISKSRESYELRMTFKTCPAAPNAYYRPYCFSRAERRERYRTLETGLDRRSRELLAQCRKCSVVLTRWSRSEASLTPKSSSTSMVVKNNVLPTQSATSCSQSRVLPTSEPIVVDLCSSDEE